MNRPTLPLWGANERMKLCQFFPFVSRLQRTSSLSKHVGFIGENPLLKDVVSAITLCTGQEVDGWQEDFTTLAHEMAHAQDRIHCTR